LGNTSRAHGDLKERHADDHKRGRPEPTDQHTPLHSGWETDVRVILALTGIAIMFDIIDRGSALQGLATIPEFIWELSLGIYLIVKGFRPAP
jgi:hypothetical protein